MKRIVLVLLAALLALPLFAQDRGDVLATWVQLSTLVNRKNPPPDVKERVEALMAKGLSDGNVSPSTGLYTLYAGFDILQGLGWTPEVQFGSALRANLKEAVLEPGSTLRVELIQLAHVDQWPEAKLDAKLYLRNARDRTIEPTLLTTIEDFNHQTLPQTIAVKLPADLAGNFDVWLQLPIPGQDQPLLVHNPAFKKMRLHVEAGVPAAYAKLETRVAEARKAVDAGHYPLASALNSAEYTVARYKLALKGSIDPVGVNFMKELTAADSLVAAVEQKKDPFANEKGTYRRAYRSPLDNSLQPYRVLVPASYDPAKPNALVVLLHGMGGDENTMIDYYDGAFRQAAEKHGLLVLAPKGRGPASMYQGDAETDVLDALADFRKLYNVDPQRIYLSGHSMGGYGTWSISMHQPQPWAALAPISGGGNPAAVDPILDIPQYIVHGDADETVPVQRSRDMVTSLKQRGAKEITFVEVPGAHHNDVVVPQVAKLFDWLVKQEKSTQTTQTKSVTTSPR